MQTKENSIAMRTSQTKPRTLINPIATALFSTLIYLILISLPNSESMIKLSLPHFYIVSISSAIAAVTAVGMGISGTRLRNPQVLFMSLSFLSLTLLFGLHGLTTPDVLMEFHPITGVAAQLSLSIMSFWLFLSSLPSDNPLIIYLIRIQRRLIPIWTSTLAAFVAYAMFMPDIGDGMPIDQEPLKWFSGGITVIFASAASYRFWRSYRYARFPLQIALTHSAGLIAVTQIILTTSAPWSVGWWWYHVLLLLATILPVIGLLQQYSRGESLVLSITGLFSTDPTERLEAGISRSVRAMVETAETLDDYMAGHSRRVALAALRLGIALKISPEKMRALAQGALLHDIGKLQVPKAVLNVQGKLNNEQLRIVQRHVEYGFEICRQLGFLPDELSIIRYHHERIDGSGYPSGLKAEDIPKLARILAVVDVYDALTSDRSYRPAWSEEKAIQHLIDNRGNLFDSIFVDAWVELAAKDQS